MTLIGQQPSPTDSAARMKVCMTSAASTEALRKASRSPLRWGCFRIAPMRSSRRASAQKTRNTGAVPVHGIAGKCAAIAWRLSGAFNLMTVACWKFDFADAESAAAISKSINPSATGRGAYLRWVRRCRICASSGGTGSAKSIFASRPNRSISKLVRSMLASLRDNAVCPVAPELEHAVDHRGREAEVVRRISHAVERRAVEMFDDFRILGEGFGERAALLVHHAA